MNIHRLILDIKQKVLPIANGQLPAQRECKFTDVLGYSGLEKFKAMLGCQNVKPRSYWTEEKVIEGMGTLGRIPSQRELMVIDGPLSSAFESLGGVRYFREKIEGVA